MTLDWITLQNGDYPWAPLNDVRTTASTMGMAGLAPQSWVRTSLASDGSTGDLVFTGSDVGGVAWSDDTEAWHTANGTGLD